MNSLLTRFTKSYLSPKKINIIYIIFFFVPFIVFGFTPTALVIFFLYFISLAITTILCKKYLREVDPQFMLAFELREEEDKAKLKQHEAERMKKRDELPDVFDNIDKELKKAFFNQIHPTLEEALLTKFNSNPYPVKLINQYQIFAKFLYDNNFKVSKEITFSKGKEPVKKFFLDDLNKNFAIICDSQQLIFKYSALLSFPLSEVTTSYNASVGGATVTRFQENSFISIKLNSLQNPTPFQLLHQL